MSGLGREHAHTLFIEWSVNMINSEFWGVYSPRGELEAVESSKALADATALALSPQIGGKPPQVPNRIVERVDIVRASFWKLLDKVDIEPAIQRTIDQLNWNDQERRRLEGEAILRRLREAKGSGKA